MSRAATTRRTRLALVLSTAALAGATTAVIQAPSYAAETTCQGKPVTIASDAGQVTGTEGPDVISAGPGTFHVDALGGDDTICFYAGTRVSAGAGNDSVTATSTGDPDLVTSIDLGPGDDTYTGTDGVDDVNGYAVPESDRTGADTISTGAGADRVRSGATGEPNRDRLDLGAGDDRLDMVLPTGSAASVAGGDGIDAAQVFSPDPGGRWTFDLSTTGSVQRDGRQLSALAGMDAAISSVTTPAAVVVRGGPASQSFALYSATPQLDVDLGDGRDTLTMLAPVGSGDGGHVDLGGDDGDTVALYDAHQVRVDLAEHVMTLGADSPARYTLLGTRNVTVSAPDVRVDGDRRNNTIQLTGCRQRAHGGNGNDRISSFGVSGEANYHCAGKHSAGLARRGAHLDGQQGNDRLVGSDRSGDVLVGGPGRDRADGAGGRDTCRAEVEKRCER